MARTDYVRELRQDIGYAVRLLRHSPGFTAVALITLALGIGATSAIFSVVHAVLLAPLPYRDAGRLYQVRTLYPDGTPYSLSAPDFMSVRADSQTLEQVEAFSTGVFTMLGAGEPREVRGATLSDGLIQLLGLPIAVGRGFAAGENAPGRTSVAVLDHGFWLRQFGGDRSVVGRTLTVAGQPYTVIGIFDPGAHLTEDIDVYAPLVYDDTFSASTAKGRRGEYLTVLGRMRSGVTGAEVEQDLRRVGTQLQKVFPQTNDTLTFTSISLTNSLVGDVRTPLLILLGAVGFVLLVACANVANLLLARASVRRSELAVRSAFGASHWRILRQLVAEAILLGLSGAVLGLGVAAVATRALVAAQPANLPRLAEVGVNGTVITFTFVVALLTSIAFGVIPALHATGETVPNALGESGRGGGPGLAGHRVRATLVVAEVALAVVLLTGAGLLIRSFIRLTQVDPGFRVENAMSFRVTLQSQKYRQDVAARARVTEFETRFRAIPGVTSVGATTVLPLSGRGAMLGFSVEGAPPPPPDVNPEIAVASVTPDYFRTIGTVVKRGRPLTDQDHTDSPLVALMNEAGVRRWFQNQDPLGKYVRLNATRREIVGIVADVFQRDASQPAVPQLFVPYAQRSTRTLRFVVRTQGDPGLHAAAIRSEIRALDPDLAITDFTPLARLVTRSVARPRFYTSLLTLFAAVALALAATGVFGVMSYAVAQRSREISIRMALGANTGDVLRMIVGRALLLCGVGVVLGLGGALALGRVIQGQLFGISLLDPLTLSLVALVLTLSAALASFLPAWRAARVDPAGALRQV
jgi:putative ABC transport system permease protein